MSWADKSIAELKAELRGKREWLASNPSGLLARSIRRDVQQIEAELEARGEKPEEERKRRPPAGRYAPIYHASHRVQMEAEGYEAEYENLLAFHEDEGDGTALCGQPANDWTDPKTGIRYPGVWRQHGPGPVTCGKCANVSGEPRGNQPLVEPQGESVRTVSGGAFESNRRRH